MFKIAQGIKKAAIVKQGDIRHSCADISRAKRVLCYEPKVPLKEGLVKLLNYYEETYHSERKAHSKSLSPPV